jgi:opacity protein-like surface antigen
MTRLYKALLVTATMMVATPVAAQTTTAFDGGYAGVSLEKAAEKGMSGRKTCPMFRSPPAALSIAGGVARFPWGQDNMLEGSVTPEGVLVMRTPHGQRFDGQIDAQGAIRGQVTGVCSYSMVWQKRSR